MGHVVHRVAIITWSDYVEEGNTYPEMSLPDIEAFRQSLPADFRPLLIGPITSVTNGYRTLFFAPSGSKSGWGMDDDYEEWRERLCDLFRNKCYPDGSSPYKVVTVDYSDDLKTISAAREM